MSTEMAPSWYSFAKMQNPLEISSQPRHPSMGRGHVFTGVTTGSRFKALRNPTYFAVTRPPPPLFLILTSGPLWFIDGSASSLPSHRMVDKPPGAWSRGQGQATTSGGRQRLERVQGSRWQWLKGWKPRQTLGWGPPQDLCCPVGRPSDAATASSCFLPPQRGPRQKA